MAYKAITNELKHIADAPAVMFEFINPVNQLIITNKIATMHTKIPNLDNPV